MASNKPNTATASPVGDMLMGDKTKLAELLRSLDVSLFEYHPNEDVLITYNQDLTIHWRCEQYLADLARHSRVWYVDQHKLIDLLQNSASAPTELRVTGKNGEMEYFVMTPVSRASGEANSALIGTVKNITNEKRAELRLKEKAHRDPLTSLYNREYGEDLVNDYLYSKGPFVSCALFVIDIDYFKQVNDTYGHLFGDTVLLAISQLLRDTFALDDIVIRAGGDEFAVFIKSTSDMAVIHRASQLLENVRNLIFSENDCHLTCSVGVCLLPENTFGYSYQQLFGDADWALYRAKKFGRDRYEFCDNLQRFESAQHMSASPEDANIDVRYLRNDVISTAFEIFEKTPNFDSAMRTLLKVAGAQLQLDRITVISTNTRDRSTARSYQWVAPGTPEVLQNGASFTKEDFLTLFHSYDSYGTTVLHYDDLDMYSPGAQQLLMQGGAKTVVYAAMYCEGHYAGAVSYVNCEAKRHWSQAQRCQLGELTKIISAHLAKSQVLNFAQSGALSAPDVDTVTGLMAFSRFRDEAERAIVGNSGEKFVMVYTDFENFKYLNRKYGYQRGDYLLKKFANHIIQNVSPDKEIYFSRILGDQFVLFRPCEDTENYYKTVEGVNARFVHEYAGQFPEAGLRLRSGIYFVDESCSSASEAIDAANYARRKVRPGSQHSACVYTKKLEETQLRENDILNSMTDALKNREFKLYLQPKFSLNDFTVVGAEALVRWQKADGTIIMPDDFVPIYERSGRILELDFYMFEQVAAFLAKNDRLGRRQVPISINASILHTSSPDTVQRYIDILKKYNVDPSLTEIELTETATVSEYDGVISLFKQFQNVGILTSLDDFGAGYSVLNAVIDIPVNTVKIDRLFLNCCESNERGVYFLKQIVSMVKGLGYHVLCEGVETEAQLKILKEAGCESGQGFLFSRPIPLEAYEALVYGKTEPAQPADDK